MDLKRKLISAAACVGISFGLLAATGGPAAADVEPPWEARIIKTYYDASGRAVLLRQGKYNMWGDGTGFGWSKISGKHDIRYFGAVGFVASNPNGGVAEGADRRYDAYANRTVCVDGKCTVTDSVPVRLIVHYGTVQTYYDVPINGVLGVKTMYCSMPNNEPKCPEWAGIALDNPSNPAGRTPVDTPSTFVDLSYEPKLKE